MNQFKITKTITEENALPVINGTKDEVKVYFCKDYSGEFSSTTGIISKFMYIPRVSNDIKTLGQSLAPSIRIVCGPECIDKCMNLKMYNNGTDKLVSFNEFSKTHKIGTPRDIPIFKGWVRKPDNEEIQNINELI